MRCQMRHVRVLFGLAIAAVATWPMLALTPSSSTRLSNHAMTHAKNSRVPVDAGHLDPARSTPSPAPCLDGLRICYYAAVGQPPLSSRSILANQLIAAGATIDEVTTPLPQGGFDSYDVLWFTTMTGPLSGTALFALEDYFQYGWGSALFESDDPLSTYYFELVISGINWFEVAAAAGSTTNLASHPTTAGISSLWFPGPAMRFGQISPAVVQDVNGAIVVTATENTPGSRIVAISDDVFDDAAITNDDNLAFGEAIFAWFQDGLFDIEQLQVSPDSSDTTLVEGDSATMTVRIDNADNCSFDYSTDIIDFADDFEDGNYDGWIDAGGSGTKQIVHGNAADGSQRSYREYNSSAGHDDGVYQMLGAIQPEFVSFWVKVASTTGGKGYFSLRDSGGKRVIFFHASTAGTFSVNPNVGGNTTVPYDIHEWYWIFFTNIDFAAKTFDYYVDGALVQTGISFKNAGVVNDFDRLDLYNHQGGSEAQWDEITIGPPKWLSSTLNPGVAPGFGFVDIDFDIDTSGLLPGTYSDFIRFEGNVPSRPRADVSVQITVESPPTGIGEEHLPAIASLGQNHPNPFNPSTTIPYEISEPGHVRLTIYSVSGELVRVLVDRPMVPGRFGETWDGKNNAGQQVSSGVYVYELVTKELAQTKKMVLLK